MVMIKCFMLAVAFFLQLKGIVNVSDLPSTDPFDRDKVRKTAIRQLMASAILFTIILMIW